LKSQRIADRDHELADPEGCGISQQSSRKIRCNDPDHSEIRVRIVTDHLGPRLPSVSECYGNLIGTMNDMAVRHDKAVWGKDKTRTAATQILLAVFHSMATFDVYHRRADLLRGADDDPRIGIECFITAVVLGPALFTLFGPGFLIQYTFHSCSHVPISQYYNNTPVNSGFVVLKNEAKAG
jgi:hypothetical protein